MKQLGVLLIALGILMLIFTGFNLKTHEKVVDVGPIKIEKEKDHPVSWSPIIGGVLLVCGIAITVMSKKTS